MVRKSNKHDDPLKVGKFGIGFKSVFHITGTLLLNVGFSNDATFHKVHILPQRFHRLNKICKVNVKLDTIYLKFMNKIPRRVLEQSVIIKVLISGISYGPVLLLHFIVISLSVILCVHLRSLD